MGARGKPNAGHGVLKNGGLWLGWWCPLVEAVCQNAHLLDIHWTEWAIRLTAGQQLQGGLVKSRASSSFNQPLYPQENHAGGATPAVPCVSTRHAARHPLQSGNFSAMRRRPAATAIRTVACLHPHIHNVPLWPASFRLAPYLPPDVALWRLPLTIRRPFACHTHQKAPCVPSRWPISKVGAPDARSI